MSVLNNVTMSWLINDTKYFVPTINKKPDKETNKKLDKESDNQPDNQSDKELDKIFLTSRPKSEHALPMSFNKCIFVYERRMNENRCFCCACGMMGVSVTVLINNENHKDVKELEVIFFFPMHELNLNENDTDGYVP